jgi:bifunctional non-homologous end joining protein LigD
MPVHATSRIARRADRSVSIPKADLPDFIPPQLATLVDRAPSVDGWVHEVKFDGYRLGARFANRRVRMLTRKALDWTAKFRPIVQAVAALKARSAYLDGEVVVLDEEGVSSFGLLQEALSEGRADRMAYYVFDLLYLDGRDLRSLPLAARKKALAALLPSSEAGLVHYCEHFAGRGPDFFRDACRANLEGIVSKRADAPYRSGRGRDWLKIKCVHQQEFVVGGWVPSTASGRELRSIHVGYFDNGKFVYAGKIGTGFNATNSRELLTRLRKHERKDTPFASVPREDQRGAHWVDPVIVIEAKFTSWTRDGKLRHPSFQGIREDKDAREVRAELPAERGHPARSAP